MSRIGPILWLMVVMQNVHAGIPEAGDAVNAKLARIKSATALVNDTKPSAGNAVEKVQQLQDGCSIAIGNVFEGASGGASTSAKRETTVIVTGDIIQAGNQCK